MLSGYYAIFYERRQDDDDDCDWNFHDVVEVADAVDNLSSVQVPYPETISSY